MQSKIQGLSFFSGGGGLDIGAQMAGIKVLTSLDVEKDAIGEVANISMGSSATTLYSLVNRKVIFFLIQNID